MMDNNKHRCAAEAAKPSTPSRPDPYRQSQLDTTVTGVPGRYPGCCCSTCLCANNDSLSGMEITQPSSGLDDLQNRVEMQLKINGAEQCFCPCEDCQCHENDGAEVASQANSVATGPRLCGPWEIGSNGDFVLRRDNDWRASTEGRFSTGRSLEMSCNITRRSSVTAPPPVTAALLGPLSCPVAFADGGDQFPGTVCYNTGEWMEPGFKEQQYACACPASSSDNPAAQGTFGHLLRGTKMHSAYAEAIADEDLGQF